MSANEFRRSMLAHAKDYADLGAKFRNGYRRMALIPLTASLISSCFAMVMPWPINLLGVTLATEMLLFVRDAVMEGERAMQRWLKMRQNCLDDMKRALGQYNL